MPVSPKDLAAAAAAGGALVKNCLPMQEMQETQVRSLGWEDPLEKEMATRSSIPAWRIPWTEGPGGRKESDTTEQLYAHAYSFPDSLPL